MKKKKNKFPNRKISETFLDFASPIINALGRDATEYQVEQVLKIAFTVWNSVVLDTVKGSFEYVSMLRETLKDDPMSSALIEQMISRKKAIVALGYEISSPNNAIHSDGNSATLHSRR